jgi:exopolysaccharide biosynthesis polyprenyl glycosylphosphotransferase
VSVTVTTSGTALYDDLPVPVNERTLEILERRRRTASIRRRGWLVRRMLLLADASALITAYAVSGLLLGSSLRGSIAVPFFVASLPLWVVLAKLYGLYDHDEERAHHGTVDDMVGVFHLVTTGAWLTCGVTWVAGGVHPNVSRLLGFWALAIVLVLALRALARMAARRSIVYVQNTLIIGAGEVGQLIAHKLLQHPEYGINLVGFVDAEPLSDRRDGIDHIPTLGGPAALLPLVRLFDIERVIVAFSRDSHDQTLDVIRLLQDQEVQVDIVPRLFEVVGPTVGLHSVEGVGLIGLPPARLSRSSRLIKRTIDLAATLAGLFVLAPFFAYAAFRIKRESPGPVFFRQVRMGADEKTFRIYKFRTMVADADDRKHEVAHLNIYQDTGDTRMFKIADDPRVTKFGAFLRRYSLDELPQLINVLKGEMSLVGPRPLILEEDCHIAEWARKRLKLKPGVTGLWQVLGRNEIPFEEMTKLDYLYVTGWSLWGDIQLVLRTIPAILRPRRAY